MSCYFLTVSSLRPSPVLSLEHPFRPYGFEAWDEWWSVKGICKIWLGSSGITLPFEAVTHLVSQRSGYSKDFFCLPKTKKRKKSVCIYFSPALNFIKANAYVNQKQGMTFWPANFLTESRTTWAFLCFLFLCCLLVLLARVTIILGASAVLVIQRFQSALQQGFLLTAGGEKGHLCCAQWAAWT